MPIEFPCTQCGKPLRTPDDSAGRQARCPQCRTIVQIPHVASATFAPTTIAVDGPSEQSGTAPADWNPFASPTIGGDSAAPRQAAGAGDIVATRADLSRVFGETKAVFARKFGLCLLLGFSLLVIYFVFALCVQLLSAVFGVGVIAAPGRGRVPGQVGAILAWAGVVILGTWLFFSWWYMGIVRCFLRVARGQRAGVGDLVSGAPYALRGMAINLIFLVINIVGMALAIGVLVAAPHSLTAYYVTVLVLSLVQLIVYLGLSQSYHLVVDRDLRAIEAIRTSMRVMSGNKLTLFLTLLGLAALAVIAILLMTFASWVLVMILGPFGVLFVALGMCAFATAATAFAFLLFSVFYLHATGQPTAESDGAAAW